MRADSVRALALSMAMSESMRTAQP